MVLLSDDHREEVQEFAPLFTSLRIHISGLGDDEVALSLSQLCLVQYFTPVHEITLNILNFGNSLYIFRHSLYKGFTIYM